MATPASPNQAAASEPSFVRRHLTKLIFSAVITASLVYALQKGGLAVWPRDGSFKHVKWWTVGAYFLTLIAFAYFRAVRWRYLLRPIATIPTRRVLAVSWIGFAAILIMPFRLG